MNTPLDLDALRELLERRWRELKEQPWQTLTDDECQALISEVEALRTKLEKAKEALATIHARAKLETPQIDQRWLAAKCEVLLAELEKP